MPVISTIVPAYNAEKTIRETIESVLKQTFTDFELLVINDGSQDGTLQVVEQIKDPRVKVFSYPNAGQGASRNRGISISTGEYIAFLDADDLWTPDKLEAQLKALQANPQTAVAYSWTNFIDESGELYRRGSHASITGDVYARLFLSDFIEGGSNPLVRREALEELGGFDESLPPAEDWDMWLRLAARYHFVVVPSPQVLYRVCPGSASTNVLAMEASSLRIIKRVVEEDNKSVGALGKVVLANRYKYLTFKALEGQPNKQKVKVALRFLANAIINEPSLLGARASFKALLKCMAIALLPPQWARALFAKFHNVFNTTTILGYMRLNSF